MSQFMKYAIQLAKMVDGQTGINPPVGSVVVKDGRIVGIGAHLQKGDKHAEVQALDMAGTQAKEATIYITLEPCSHYGSTPPCVNKIIDAQISKVIYATKDQSLETHGDDILHAQGIEVEYQYDEEAASLYQYFFKAKAQQIPEITVKVAASLDGKQANDNGQSQWITNKEVKQDVYQLRHKHDAVLTGRGTVELDNPQYTTRFADGKNPIKIILSRSGDLDFRQQLFQDTSTAIWIYTENPNLTTDKENIDIIYLQQCQLTAILQDIYQKGVGKLLVEAGPHITSEFLQSGYIDEFILYFAPKLIGGSGTYQYYQTDDVFNIPESNQFEIVHSELINQNIKLILRKK
ncbi:bifunctional diaminohydroxyphosphoribosylaminopyrimidine deaminase/5-amino-6-(5-phosphoribosylamino)uracil reductase RibD [Staphylococcus simiae]|uniref:bifunctional diaminohydroxyphosphoribosylaminopyrimidine deaminase/5-amino-6-(5-phosphoribosylamino)uracil reductase RibD n=1 Tax=Staphylococcus simiae TaxID=308354 RepID=UPI001A967867|nr:bifunctional diaminohydroxyphosphoribosylaminopyrimidine deaminase/5-amino-6-(5-phosphoribosylamino)uracil reductase RibD [Staphylococcus simiae]MBO1199955.1 bifunctional diaminohydroxyphosphoribosylaminopyrimidine deaminase/5-amino-6-(5-phosphoribosylamino)uracil reductase RibD [Staphylococcus simiae]MBO1202217.1 bifunctional diaminohydroxyphosphoribosylaminopyrimidine deaminase/5-amino-6-(5-phosphoribosylamino)uracil reductase RibD [Staphylococcus simiae]MBO1204474.1 bifunctional diaminohyd